MTILYIALYIFFIIYIATGFIFLLSTASKLDDRHTRNLVKGDKILAVIYLPFTLVLGVTFLMAVKSESIWKSLKNTKFIEWWKTPISKK